MIFQRGLCVLVILALVKISWAAEVPEVRINIHDVSEPEEEAKEAEPSSCCKNVREAIKETCHNFLEKLGTPKGAAIVACSYGLSQCVSDFLWAFDWEGHLGFSNEISKKIWEAGGLSASGECLLLGVFVPAMLYSYQKKHPSPAQLGVVLPGNLDRTQ